MSNLPPATDWKKWGAPIAVAALLLWLLSARFELPAAPMDEGMLLVYPEQILKGKLPYRDFDSAYGPANPYVLAGAYAVFGHGIFVERAVGLGYRLLILAAIFALGRRWGSHVGAGCMLLAGLFLIPTNVVAYAWMGGVACMLWCLWAATSGGGGGRKFCAGMLAAAALLYRADLGPAVLLATGALLMWMPARDRKCFIAGATCGLLPLAALALAVGPVRLYENLFHFPVLHSGRKLPIGLDSGWMLWILGMHMASSVLAIVSGWLAARSDRTDIRARLLVALGLCALGCSHQAVQRFDPTHLFFACFLSIGILPLALLTAVERQRGPSSSLSRPMLAVASVLLAVAITSPAVISCMHQAVRFSMGTEEAAASFIRVNARAYPLRSSGDVQRTAACLEVVQWHAAPGERLFVGPRDLRQTNYNDTFIYHLLPELTPATYFLEMNPGSANRPSSQLASDVASADWLILNRFWDEPTLDRAARNASDAPCEVVRTQFTLVHDFSGFEVYRRTARVARN